MTHERLDLKKIQFPKKEAKTPTKNGLPGSRPGSPEREVVSRSPTSPPLLPPTSLISWLQWFLDGLEAAPSHPGFSLQRMGTKSQM